MRRFSISVLALAALGGSAAVAHDDGEVRIIRPPARHAAATATAPEPQKPVVFSTTNVNVVLVTRIGLTRAERRKRALFQNWTGFVKVHRGDLYPF